MDNTFIFLFLNFRGIVSVTTNSLSAEFVIFSSAFPLRIGCVIRALTDLAPFSICTFEFSMNIPPPYPEALPP